MDQQSALKMFDLTSTCSVDELHDLRKRRRYDIEEAILVSPSEALKRKYRDELLELETAFQVLIGDGNSLPPGLNVTRVRMRSGGKLFYRGDGSAGPAARPGVMPGDLLKERFEIQHLIGAGALGATFDALDRATGKRCCVKVFLPSHLATADATQRFEQWRNAIVKLGHSKLLKVLEVMEDGDFRFVVSEWVEAKNLRQWLRDRGGSSVSVAEAMRLIEEAALGIEYLHQNFGPHGDLKPENILLLEGEGLKISDAGQMSILSPEEIMKVALISGTSAYIAPDQKGTVAPDARSDQYALALIAYEILAGGLSASGKLRYLREVRKDVPEGLAQAIDRALDGDSNARFPSVRDFVSGCSAEALDATVEIKREAVPEKPQSSSTQPKQGGGLVKVLPIALGALLVVAGIGYLISRLFLGGSSDVKVAQPPTIESPVALPTVRANPRILALWQEIEKKRVGIASGLLERFVKNSELDDLLIQVKRGSADGAQAVDRLEKRLREVSMKLDEALIQPQLDEGIGLLKGGKPEEAIKVFEAAKELAPQSSSVHLDLALALLATDRPTEAITALESAVALDAKNVKAHLALGKILKARGRTAEASQQLQAVLKLDPNNKDAKKILDELEY